MNRVWHPQSDQTIVGLVSPSADYPTYLPHPFYYVRSGNIDVDVGRLWNAGIGGAAWSPSAAVLSSTTNTTAYYLGFDAAIDYPSNGPRYRWYGFPLRWLSNGGKNRANDNLRHLKGGQYGY